MKFLDEVKIFAKAGDGGGGAVSFRREKFIPKGGPDGGNGAKGGDIIAHCVQSLNTLIDYRYHQHVKAMHGQKGKGKNRNGLAGKNKILDMPIGTQIFDEAGEILLAELNEIGQKETILYGGAGGRGNASFKSARNQAPYYAQNGQKGQEACLRLRLRLIADIGLIGEPNAGKSSLLAKISASKTKIASYPFTTKKPHLGFVHTSAIDFAIADIPGLIEGAHKGKGLGQKFLSHIERCASLAHLIDASLDDPISHWQMVRDELESYGGDLAQKDELTILSKSDLVDDKNLQDKLNALNTYLNQKGKPPALILSIQNNIGVEEVKSKMAHALLQSNASSSIKAKNRAQNNSPNQSQNQSQSNSWHP